MHREKLLSATLRSLVMFSIALLTAAGAAAQDRPKEPEVLSLRTKDGVEIVATYYASLAGKQATPVVLLADWKDSRSVYDELAKRLQAPREGDKHPSFAVVAVDLRGHGDSTRQRLPGGQTRTIDAARLDRRDIAAMVQFDMETVRRFLVTKNDAGELNINRLSLVGAGLGAMVAVNWAAVDWSAPPLAVGKQGQDVKALVLVSPQWSFKGLQLSTALRHPGVREEIAFLIMYGKRERSYVADVTRIEKQLERYHPKPESPVEGEPHSLTIIDPDTALQGTQFLTEPRLAAPVQNAIITFLSVHVAEKDLLWSQRRRN